VKERQTTVDNMAHARYMLDT